MPVLLRLGSPPFSHGGLRDSDRAGPIGPFPSHGATELRSIRCNDRLACRHAFAAATAARSRRVRSHLRIGKSLIRTGRGQSDRASRRPPCTHAPHAHRCKQESTRPLAHLHDPGGPRAVGLGQRRPAARGPGPARRLRSTVTAVTCIMMPMQCLRRAGAQAGRAHWQALAALPVNDPAATHCPGLGPGRAAALTESLAARAAVAGCARASGP
jgi:hypothetical protein